MVDLERWSADDLPDRVVGGMVGAGAGVLFTLAFGPVAGVLVAGGATPALEEASRFARRALERMARRAGRAVVVAADDVGCSADEFLDRATTDDRLTELVTRALGAAAASMADAKVDALGRAMAAGVLASDDAKVDESVLVVEALAQLEMVDLGLLDLMATRAGNAGKTGEAWTWSHLAESTPKLAPVLDSVIARLSAAGVISDAASGMSFQTSWHVTEFGRTCLSYLAEHHSAEDES